MRWPCAPPWAFGRISFATAVPTPGTRNYYEFFGRLVCHRVRRGAHATPAVNPGAAETPRDEAGAAHRGGAITPLGGLLLGLGLLGPPRLAVLLDLGFGEALVLGTDHPEDGRRAVRATGHRAELDRPLAPFAHAESLPGAPQERGGSAPTERRQHRLARARHCVLFDQRRQSIHKLLNEILNVGPFGHLVFSPLVARRRLAAKNRRCKAKRLILRRSVSKQWPVARLVTFIAVAFALLAGIHYYLWARLVRDPRWPASWTTVGGTLLALLALSVPLSLILGRAGQAGVRQTVVWTGYIWLGLMFLLLTTVFFSDLLRLLGAFGRRLLATRPFDPQRRFLHAARSAAGSGILASSLGAVGLSAVRKPVDVRRVEVRLD